MYRLNEELHVINCPSNRPIFIIDDFYENPKEVEDYLFNRNAPLWKINEDGTNNVAPFSYFNGVCSNPPTIMFAPARRGYDGKTKDTLNNIRETNEFAINIVSEEIVEPMVACSTDYSDEVDEFKISDFTPIQCDKILAPRVEESKVVFECKLNTIIEIGPSKPGGGFVVIGEIVLFHINDDVFKDGKIDPVPVESKPVNEINGILDDLKNGKVPGLVSISHN